MEEARREKREAADYESSDDEPEDIMIEEERLYEDWKEESK